MPGLRDGRENDRGRFKTPTLREVERTSPYMHNGSKATLDEVVNFYDEEGRANPNLDIEIRPRLSSHGRTGRQRLASRQNHGPPEPKNVGQSTSLAPARSSLYTLARVRGRQSRRHASLQIRRCTCPTLAHQRRDQEQGRGSRWPMMDDLETIDAETLLRMEICGLLSEAYDALEPLIAERHAAAARDRFERLHVGELMWRFRYNLLDALEREFEATPQLEWRALLAECLDYHADAETIDDFIKASEIEMLERQLLLETPASPLGP
jgi:hypothetical protein